MEKIKNTALATLRWTERYTKTDMVYLAHGGFWATLSQVVVSASTFLLAIMMARFVSKEIYGQYKFILSLASVLGTFTLTGLGPAVMQSVNRGFEGTMHDAFWKNIKWSALFILLCLGASIYYFQNGNYTIGIAMLLIGCLSPILASTNLYNAYLDAKKDFRRNAIYFGIIGNVFPALCLFLSIFIHKSPLTLISVYFISNTLIGVILYLKIASIYKPNKSVDSEALAYGKHLSFMNILSVVSDNIDQVLVFHYIGAVELAIYNFAIAIPSQIKGVMKGFAGLIFPKFIERSDSEIRAGMRSKYLFLTFSAVSIITSYIFCAPYIFKYLFPTYTESIFYSQVFAISMLWIIAIPSDAYLVSKKKIKEQYIGNIAGAIIQIIVFSIGVIGWGLLGLVIAQIVSKIARSLLSIILYEKVSKTV